MREYIYGFMAMFMTGAFLWVFFLLVAQSDANKAQQRAFLCFDAQGRVSTSGSEPFLECRRVAIRELRRHG